MKKLLSALIATATVSMALVGVSSSSAQARSCTDYVCVKTTTGADAPDTVRRGVAPSVDVSVTPRGSDESAKGTVKVTCKKGSRTVKSANERLRDGSADVRLPRLRSVGKWTCTIRFSGARGYQDSSRTVTVKVVRR